MRYGGKSNGAIWLKREKKRNAVRGPRAIPSVRELKHRDCEKQTSCVLRIENNRGENKENEKGQIRPGVSRGA